MFMKEFFSLMPKRAASNYGKRILVTGENPTD
jgi:hypothetical protein